MIIIPDIHGRSFWKDAVQGHEDEEIIFLGDYLDPYYWENIDGGDALDNFQDIMFFKEDHPNNVILLLGNHDLHYLVQGINGGRKMTQYAQRIKEDFLENKHMFQLAYEKKIGDKLFVFSHAGIREGWINQHTTLNLPHSEGIAEALNNAYNSEDNTTLITALSTVSMCRGGMHPYGSPIWADVREHMSDMEQNECPNFYQVFGHSQQESEPIITTHFACLDCRRAFEIDNEGKITMI